MSDKAKIRSEGNKGKPRLSRRKRLLFFLILLGTALTLSLLLMEMGVRIFYPQPLTPPIYRDTSWGFSIRPNLSGVTAQTDAREPYRLTTDAHGFRGLTPTPEKKEEGSKRILVIGDSFTFGVGVDDKETFPFCTENFLNRSEGKSGKFEIINAGCPGWGTDNALGFWLDRGRLLKPDLVVLAVFRNDFTDNMKQNIFKIRDGKVLRAPPINPSVLKKISRWVPFYEFLCTRSHLLNLIRRLAAHRPVVPLGEAGKENKLAPPGDDLPPNQSQKSPSDIEIQAERKKKEIRILKDQTEVFKALMVEFIESAEEEKVPMLVLLLPGTTDIDPYPSEHFKAAQLATEEWAAGGRIDFLNSYSALREAAANGRVVYLPKDHHFTPEGNRIVGELLGEKILDLYK